MLADILVRYLKWMKLKFSIFYLRLIKDHPQWPKASNATNVSCLMGVYKIPMRHERCYYLHWPLPTLATTCTGAILPLPDSAAFRFNLLGGMIGSELSPRTEHYINKKLSIVHADVQFLCNWIIRCKNSVKSVNSALSVYVPYMW